MTDAIVKSDTDVRLEKLYGELRRDIQIIASRLQRRETEEESFQDPQSFLTKHLAKWSPRVDERTRVMSYEELDYLDSLMFLSQVLGVKLYEVEAQTHGRWLISKDGKSREESVQSLQFMNDLQRGFNTGFPVVTAGSEPRDRK